MDMKEIQELAKAAAYSAAIASHSGLQSDEKRVVDTYLEAYEYAFKRIAEKQRQSQNDVNMEFGSNEARFR